MINITIFVSGLVDTSLSNVQRFTPYVRRCVKNEVVVQLVDSYQNPVLAEQTKLNFQVFSVNSSNFMKWEFLDKGNGSYTGHYMAKDLGAYKICIFFEDRHLSPCPFEVHAYESKCFYKSIYLEVLVMYIFEFDADYITDIMF